MKNSVSLGRKNPNFTEVLCTNRLYVLPGYCVRLFLDVGFICKSDISVSTQAVVVVPGSPDNAPV